MGMAHGIRPLRAAGSGPDTSERNPRASAFGGVRVAWSLRWRGIEYAIGILARLGGGVQPGGNKREHAGARGA